MTRDLTAVSPETSVAEAAKTMARQRLTGVPVVDEDNVVVGFISESDIIRSVVPTMTRGEGLFAPVDFVDVARRMSQVGERTVGDFMSERAITVTTDTDIYELSELMLGKGYKTLPVVKDGRLEGVVHRSDVSTALMELEETDENRSEEAR